MSGIIALDLETTGLIKPDYMPGIIEFGIYKRGQTESWFINPEITIEEEVWNITGINPDHISEAPTLPEIFIDIARCFLGCEILLTFNGPSFDIPILKHNLGRYNLLTKFPWPPIQLDIMDIGKQAMQLQGKTGIKPPKLTELYTYLFEDEFPAHRAGFDAKATHDCYVELINKGYM